MGITFGDAMMLFYHWETYKTLQQKENTLWVETAEYIADCYFEEMENEDGR